jgi:hypothetical protein
MAQICGVPVRLDVKAISCPVGLQQGAVSLACVVVSRRAPAPSAPATHTSVLPARLLAKARLFPSGLKEAPKIWLSPFSPLRLATLWPSKILAR